MIELMLGDCLEKMKDIPDGSVDLILCDLPYGTTACKWDVVIPFEPLWDAYWRIAKPNAAVVLFGSEPFSSHLRMSARQTFRYDWYWDKKFAGNYVQAKRMPLKTIENISVFCRQKCPSYYPIMVKRDKPIKKGGIRKSEAIPVPHNPELCKQEYAEKYPITLLSYNVRDGRGEHPTQKPVALLEYLIRTYTNEGDLVLDNCMGSGSTGVAAKNLNRSFIGIEKDPKFFEIAKSRINAKPD